MLARILATLTRTDRTDAPGLPYGVYKHRPHTGNLTGSTRPAAPFTRTDAPGKPYGEYRHRPHAGNHCG
jgi:hypothetical protein